MESAMDIFLPEHTVSAVTPIQYEYLLIEHLSRACFIGERKTLLYRLFDVDVDLY